MKQSCTLRGGCQHFYLYDSLESGGEIIKCCICKWRVTFSILLISSPSVFFWISCLSVLDSALFQPAWVSNLQEGQKARLGVTFCNRASDSRSQRKRKYHCTAVQYVELTDCAWEEDTRNHTSASFTVRLAGSCLLENSFCFPGLLFLVSMSAEGFVIALLQEPWEIYSVILVVMRALSNKAENDQDVVKMFRRFWADLGRQVFIPVS